MKDEMLHILGRLAGNRPVQKLLEFNVLVSTFLMGMGSGGSPRFSGEAAFLRALASQHSGRMCIFDVGANTGQFLGEVRQAFRGKQADIHVFEPGCDAYELLERGVREEDGITLNNLALGKAAGTAQLHYDESGSLTASLTKRQLAHCGITCGMAEEVMVDTLDKYCSSKGISAIDLLKIDVEGHELDVLHGGEEMFSKSLVKTVLFEFAEAAVDTRIFVKDFFGFFSRHGMSLSRLTPSGYLVPMPRYTEFYEHFQTTMLVASQPGPESRKSA